MLTASAPSVLCVDLDGTLVRSDLFWECFLFLLKTRPLVLLMVPFWLLRGRAYLKDQLAQRAVLDIAAQPYRPEILSFLKEKKDSGCHLVLVSACADKLATRVADHLGIFDSVFASEPGRNLKGRVKAQFLQEKYGRRGFDYIGDSHADLKVWQVARTAYVVGDRKLSERAARLTEVGRVFSVNRMTLRTFVSAIRGHHWFKNVLVFLPVALAHRLGLHSFIRTFAGFLLFGMCASGIYVLNDLLDLHSDREHPWKQKRPFAAGDISVPYGFIISFVLLATALPCAFFLSFKFAVVLIGYVALTMWYSVHLKTIVLLDAFILSSFYSIRIWAGALITATPLSQWFLSFSLFFFLSMSMAKRYSELMNAKTLVESGRSGRGYLSGDRELLMNLGVASGFSAVVVFSLYVNSREVTVLYRTPEALLLLAPLLAYWISRLWLKAHRGELHDDPITLALRDYGSYAVAAVAAIILAISMFRLG